MRRRRRATELTDTRPVVAPDPDVLERELRAHPGYQFVEFDAFTDGERRALGTLVDDAAYAGVLRPREGYQLRMKAVDARTAELFKEFAEPRRSPEYVRRRLGDRAREHIVELILSDVLQIRDGTFVSGPEARDVVGLDHPDDEPHGPLGRLSLAAVRYVARLEIDEPLALAAQLYFFGRAPVTPRWHRRLADSTAVQGFLGFRGAATASWRCAADSSSRDAWLHWSACTEQERVGPLPYKLYVSPTLPALPEAMVEVLSVFADEGVQHFKIGADAPGLARPDKLVAYFPAFEPLERTARQLAPRLAGVPAHGVPFTAGLSEDGMLSWGLDPPDRPDADWSERASWRSWIALRLAAGLIDARASRAPAEPWRHALERLRAAGIDTTTWTPADRYREQLWE